MAFDSLELGSWRYGSDAVPGWVPVRRGCCRGGSRGGRRGHSIAWGGSCGGGCLQRYNIQSSFNLFKTDFPANFSPPQTLNRWLRMATI